MHKTTNTQHPTPFFTIRIHSFPTNDLTVFSKSEEDTPDHLKSNGIPSVLLLCTLYLVVNAIAVDTPFVVELPVDDPAKEDGEDSESLFGGTSLPLPLSFPALYLIVLAIPR